MLTLLLATSALAACPDGGVTVEAFNANLDAATTAFTAFDREGVNERALDAYQSVPCLTDTITPAHAEKFHLVTALQALLARDEELTVGALRATLRIEPDYAMPSALGRPGAPLHNLFEEARRRPPSQTEPVGSAQGEATLVDGRKSTERPTEIPTILQRVGEGWVVLETAYLPPGEPLPEWAKPRAIDLEASIAQRKPPSPIPFFVAGGALAATSIVSTILGVVSRNEFDDPSTPYDELEGLRDRTNTAATVSAVSGAAALGLGGAGLYVVIRF